MEQLVSKHPVLTSVQDEDNVLMAHVGVLGSSGSIGSKVAARLAVRGLVVHHHTRDANKVIGVNPPHQVFGFDPHDIAKLREFVRGCSSVIYTLDEDSNGSSDFFYQTTRALISAMREEKVTRLIAITLHDHEQKQSKNGGLLSVIAKPFVDQTQRRDKLAQEQLIKTSGLDWTIIHPTRYTPENAAARVRVRLAADTETSLKKITHNQVAEFLTKELIDGRYLEQFVRIGT